MVSSRLQVALEKIRGRYGWQAVQAAEASTRVAVLPTGLAVLDQALGIGGLPRGRISVVQGAMGSGKRSLAQHCLARASHEGYATYIDATGSLDPAYLHCLGADLRQVVVVRPGSATEAWSAALALLRAGMPFLALESVGGVPEAAVSALPAATEEGESVMIILDDRPHLALDHAASLRLEITRQAWSGTHSDITGAEVLVRVAKNKLAFPGGQALIHLAYPHPVLPAGLSAKPAQLEMEGVLLQTLA
jgi:RecA/RadA recombinase